MRYEFTRVRHNPPESYGDCLRMCVASILDRDWQDVPHFFETGFDGIEKMRDWANTQGLVAVVLAVDGSIPLTDFLAQWEEINWRAPSILIGSNRNGEDHAVCMIGGTIVHNPDLGQAAIVKANSTGFWNLILFVNK